MSASKSTSPEIMPVLSVGRHRSPRRGACFMEYASYLAGERWSDHPACTHPALAFMARMVNDGTSDQGRSKLVELIPSVIGLTSDHPGVGIAIAIRCATAALPIASEERQQALAAGIICCEEWDEQNSMPLDERDRLIGDAFAQAPQAEKWAREFLDTYPNGNRSIDRMTESIIRIAILGIAQACVPDPDERLRSVLVAAIADCTKLIRPTGSTVRPPVFEVVK